MTLLCTKRVEDNKWCFVEKRSSVVPRDWEDRYHWRKVLEPLLKFKELLDEQEKVTTKLKREQAGLDSVDTDDTIKNALYKTNHD